jgi:hypothetical protein
LTFSALNFINYYDASLEVNRDNLIVILTQITPALVKEYQSIITSLVESDISAINSYISNQYIYKVVSIMLDANNKLSREQGIIIVQIMNMINAVYPVFSYLVITELLASNDPDNFSVARDLIDNHLLSSNLSTSEKINLLLFQVQIEMILASKEGRAIDRMLLQKSLSLVNALRADEK